MLCWEKLGLVWGPGGDFGGSMHSALQPTPVLIDDGNTIRVFVGVRDKGGVGRVYFVDLCADDPTKVKAVAPRPVLDIGEPGCFDENGVIPCAVVRTGDVLRLFYAGYMCPSRTRFIVFSGCAESHDEGKTFFRKSRVPILERSDSEPLFRVIHSILHDNGKWRVWYGAGDRFIEGEKKTLPTYNVRYMESNDGLSFPASGDVAIDVRGDEHRVGRPYVFRAGDQGFAMFYGYGSEVSPYRLGMALSKDGLQWIRKDDDLGINLSDRGWDCEMMAYPAVIATRTGTYMLYNGNAYGRDGFGIARLSRDGLGILGRSF